MPLFRLSSRLEFPPAWLARADGLLCIGGGLSCERILLAYQNGIFPWFSDNEPILWWSPDPRLVLYPSEIRISKSLRKTLKKNRFCITINQAFEQTISACSQPRKDPNEGTWLVEEMKDAYIELHHQGHAHSVEAWHQDRLVGGLYGVAMGCVFFGESMFSLASDASKAALVALARHLDIHGFDFIDCQVTTDHLCRMGAVEIPRNRFLDLLGRSIIRQPGFGVWERPFIQVM
ncbi:MAG: leucyl/phenylalanyl-tRNA--protein transferase [Desulfotignum sp.]